MMLPFTDIESWSVNDTSEDVTKNGIVVVCSDGEYFFAVEVSTKKGSYGYGIRLWLWDTVGGCYLS